MQDDEDIQVIQRICGGDVQAYEVLVRKYQGLIRGYCRGVVGNAADADDAAQEVFIKAYRGLGNFRAASSFSTWLYRIAVNHCRDFLRRAMRVKTESWEALRESEGESLEARTAVPPDVLSPDSGTRQVREALDRLPENYREVLILREVQGLTYQELAESLNCSVDAVKARLKRARQELEAKFKRAGV